MASSGESNKPEPTKPPTSGASIPPAPVHRRRVVIQGLSPIRKPGAGFEGETTIAAAKSVPVLPYCIGHGYDIHRLERGKAGGKLVLAGVTVSEELSPVAHSDGDVIFHAVVDAMLGALALGDIGEFFADSDPRWKDASSRIFVEDVYDRARKAGYRLANCDVTLLLEKPKIMPHKPAMIENLRRMFGTQAAVNIKAGTNEGCDAVGRGEAVAAHAVVLLATQM